MLFYKPLKNMNNLYKITNYTNSDKSCTADYIVETITPTDYVNLVKECIKTLNETLGFRISVSDITSDEITAIQELIASFAESISPNHVQREYVKEDGVFYLESCMVLKKDVKASTKKIPNYRNDITRFKAEWRDKLPLKNFVRCFKFPADSKATCEKIL